MENEKITYAVKGIKSYDRCKDEALWKQDKNVSTYYNHTVETQCEVATRSIEQIMGELIARKQNHA